MVLVGGLAPYHGRCMSGSDGAAELEKIGRENKSFRAHLCGGGGKIIIIIVSSFPLPVSSLNFSLAPIYIRQTRLN